MIAYRNTEHSVTVLRTACIHVVCLWKASSGICSRSFSGGLTLLSHGRQRWQKVLQKQENIIMFVIIIILLPKCCLIFANFSTICSIIVIFQHSNTVIVFLLIPQSLRSMWFVASSKFYCPTTPAIYLWFLSHFITLTHSTPDHVLWWCLILSWLLRSCW